jgi:hypothetical protein
MDHALKERKLSGDFKAVRSSTCLALLLLAVLHTAGNLAKPLHIDDAAYYYYARQATQKPLDPYGFEMFWYDNPEPANEVLAPPALSYWWSLSMRIDHAVSSATGIEMERPWIWKLGMVPFSLLFIGCLYTLFRHFARGLEMPLTWLTVISPTFWPSLNLMLDIPTIALSLLAILLFKWACDRGAPGLAALAGLVAGLAMEMKYTAFLTPAVMLLYSLFLGKFRLWPVAGIVAAQVFVVWELLIALLYGESHFLYHYRLRAHEGWLHKVWLLLPMLGVLGSLAPALVLLALKGMRVPWPFLVAVAFVAILGYGLVACMEEKDSRLITFIDRYISAGASKPHLPFQECWFGAWGAFLVGTTVCAAALLAGIYPRPVNFRALSNRINRRRFFPRHSHRVIAFLVLWLLLEIAGYTMLTPFVAVRRLMGVIIVATLIVGSLAARTCRLRGGRGILWAIAGYGMLMGLGFTALDWRDAQAEREAVERSVEFINARGGGKVWFASHWGFQYYAEHAGMEMISPTESRLEKGDWVVIPDEMITKQHFDEESIPRGRETDVVIDDWIPLQTVWCYYLGYTAVENRSEPRVKVRIYRVTAPCIPERPKRRS